MDKFKTLHPECFGTKVTTVGETTSQMPTTLTPTKTTADSTQDPNAMTTVGQTTTEIVSAPDEPFTHHPIWFWIVVGFLTLVVIAIVGYVTFKWCCRQRTFYTLSDPRLKDPRYKTIKSASQSKRK